LWQGYQHYLLIQNWDEIVGENIAGISEVEKINQGTIFVIVKDSVWAHHLSFLKPQIIKKLNAYIDHTAIKEIYFKLGDLGNDKLKKEE